MLESQYLRHEMLISVSFSPLCISSSHHPSAQLSASSTILHMSSGYLVYSISSVLSKMSIHFFFVKTKEPALPSTSRYSAFPFHNGISIMCCVENQIPRSHFISFFSFTDQTNSRHPRQTHTREHEKGERVPLRRPGFLHCLPPSRYNRNVLLIVFQ